MTLPLFASTSTCRMLGTWSERTPRTTVSQASWEDLPVAQTARCGLSTEVTLPRRRVREVLAARSALTVGGVETGSAGVAAFSASCDPPGLRGTRRAPPYPGRPL